MLNEINQLIICKITKSMRKSFCSKVSWCIGTVCSGNPFHAIIV